MEVRMARTGRPKAVLVLDDEEQDTLARWARRPSSPQSLALRSKIVLACAEGKSNQEVAAECGCSPATVGNWRSRFLTKRLKGLADEHRSGVPRTITDDHVEAVIVKTLTEKPHDATHWSTRGLAKSLGMSQPTVSWIWKAFGLKPWQEENFKLSEDPLSVDKVRDIVALYMNPPERAVVICVDEENGRSGVGPHPAGPAVAASHTGTQIARLQTARHHRPFRRAQPYVGHGHPPTHRPPSGHRVQKVSRHARPHHPRRAERSRCT
jgi:transposase